VVETKREWPDAELISERIISREAKVKTWEAEKHVLQNRIDQYQRMIARDREYLNGPVDEEI